MSNKLMKSRMVGMQSVLVDYVHVLEIIFCELAFSYLVQSISG